MALLEEDDSIMSINPEKNTPPKIISAKVERIYRTLRQQMVP